MTPQLKTTAITLNAPLNANIEALKTVFANSGSMAGFIDRQASFNNNLKSLAVSEAAYEAVQSYVDMNALSTVGDFIKAVTDDAVYTQLQNLGHDTPAALLARHIPILEDALKAGV